ncbi:hypothetical protein SAMN05216204_10884 [Massilia yuzhufengensis]|uniref:Uncharacterized protein n=2 Tax=Massilia yuzhufengensis TaxID=1164594 RepID=A0A1I1KRL6_9BURK|nr:hypothetical protein SAMN05216204_10884 [Massilia yuzhufengensis]
MVPMQMSGDLRVSSVTFDQPFERFRTAAKASDDIVFAGVMDALRRRDLAALAAHGGRLAELEESGQPAAFLDLWSKSLNLQTVSVLAKVCLGGHSLFYWQVDTPRGPYVRQFTVQPSTEAARNDASSVTMVGRLLRSAFQVLANGAVKPRSPALAADMTEVALKLPMAAAAGMDLAVRVHGVAVTASVNALSRPQRTDPLLTLFDTAYARLKAGDAAAFAAVLTLPGQVKFNKWWNGRTPAEAEAFRKSLEDRQVAYQLFADPVRVIFYLENQQAQRYREIAASISRGELTGAEAGAALAALQYRIEYVLTTPEQAPKLANFYAEDFLSDFLKSRELFIRQVVAPTIVNALAKTK